MNRIGIPDVTGIQKYTDTIWIPLRANFAANQNYLTMKIAVIIARVVLGLVYASSSIFFFLGMMPKAELGETAGTFVGGLAASGYLMPLVKVIELACGVALISGRFLPLTTVVIFPITLNVFLFHAFLAPEGVAVPIVMMAANLFLAYANLEKYQPMLALK